MSRSAAYGEGEVIDMKTIRLSQLKEEFDKLPEGSMLSISLEPEKEETEDQKEEIKERKEGKKNE
jgi:hypothetical protein